jgi:hypothetical protein
MIFIADVLDLYYWYLSVIVITITKSIYRIVSEAVSIAIARDGGKRMNRHTSMLPMLVLLGLAACQQTPLPDPIACSSTGSDSQELGGGYSVITSIDGMALYHTFSSPRRSRYGAEVTLQYLVHEPPATARAVLVLIPGGQFTAGIAGSGDGSVATSAGSNFLVRSAHLFAQRGYRVVTMERPSDYIDYTGGDSSAYFMDAYRTSVAHSVDLAAIINRVNTTNLPVLLAGTSRGAISAVAQAPLFSAIAISSPLTGGSNGDPVSHADAAKVAVPVHVLWHADDACSVTVPVNSYTLSDAFPDGDGVGLSGGFSPSGNDPCGALSYHGFLGIESCAVSTTTAWLDALALPGSRPTAGAISVSASASADSTIDLSSAITPGSSTLSYSLPFTTTTKGGTVSISGSTVTYSPAGSGTDTFVYVVKENGGGTAFNTVTVNVSP